MKEIISLFQIQFFVHAFITGILISIICGIIGSYIVSKRLVFLSGGITHTSFGGIGLGYLLGINPLLTAAFFGIFSGIGIEYLSRKADLRNDSLIAMLWALGMALGIIFIYLTPGYAPNLVSYLFGNVLTVTITEIYFLIALTVIIILFFILFIHPILYIAFDEEFAKTQKMPVSFINYTLIILTALTIILSIRVAGIIMVLALLTVPQNIANMFTRSFKKIIFLSILFGFAGTLSGLLFSYFFNIPSGASIVFSLVVLFVLLKIIRFVTKI